MTIPLSKYLPNVSPIALGCMGFGGDWNAKQWEEQHLKQMHDAADCALDNGINFFDHADIYTRGKAESVFGAMLKERPDLRERIILQSKCGIRFEDKGAPGRYDFSKDWILASVDGILQRLSCDYLDILLLHRPDPLMEPDEVAEAFSRLHASGKVRNFGVSNMHSYQIQFLQNALSYPLVINQLEMSLKNLDWLNEGFTAGMETGKQHAFSPAVVEHSRLNNIQLQAWGCLAQGLFSGRDVTGQAQNIRATADLVAGLASEYGVSKEAIVLGWLTRHPSGIQPVIGTTNPDRIRACAEASKIVLSREHWYQLTVAARGVPLP